MLQITLIPVEMDSLLHIDKKKQKLRQTDTKDIQLVFLAKRH